MLNVKILLVVLFCEHFMIASSVNINQSINKHLLNNFNKLRHDTSLFKRYAYFRSFRDNLKFDTIRRRGKRKLMYQSIQNITMEEHSANNDHHGLCPRSREDAAMQGRHCLRKCEKDSDCISAKKRCLCDGLCGMSCVRPDLNCAELIAIRNGNFKVYGNHFGAKVVYNCDKEYFMSGPKERTCQGDGTWSDHTPACRREAKCGAPSSVAHARYTTSIKVLEFPIDTIVEYTCFPGYQSKGFIKAKCLFYNGTVQWFGPDLKCIPQSCGPPGEIKNGHREGNVFTFTSKVTYYCNQGYQLYGRANRYCQSNGTWSGYAPSCEPIACEQPSELINGKVHFSSTTLYSIAKYECNYGYNLVGSDTQICGSSKTWEGDQPRCVEIDCGWPKAFYNGYFEGTETILGSVLWFKCFDGMAFIGTLNMSTCLENGTWSNPVPSCLSPCLVPEIEQGRVNNAAPGHLISHEKMIDFTCKPKYEPMYEKPLPVCQNGTWTYIPKCIPTRCKTLPQRPKNGIVIVPRSDHDSKALFKCKDGFSLIGHNVTRCYFGKWLDPTPICKEIYCPFPGYIEYGRVLLVGHMGTYDYRYYIRKVATFRQITFDCNKGYYLKGPSKATCIGSKWRPSNLPKCLKASYPTAALIE